jgi:C4-dicarboxylate transporter DctM subunit
MILLIATLIFFGGIVIGVPLFFSVGLTNLFYYKFAGEFPYQIILQQIQVASESFPILAVPFFVLAGQLMMDGGAGKRIVKFTDSFVRWLPGGLAMVTVVAAMIFAGMSGSLIADAAAVGAIMIPGMVKRGYHKNFGSAIVASSGSIGVIIPPSIPMVLIGFITSTSVAHLFLGGIIPGILVGLSLMIAAGILAKIRNYPTEPAAGVKEVIRDFIYCLPALGMLFIILGGIFAGIFTATEAAAVAVVYGLIVGFLVHRELKWKDLPSILIKSSVTSATVIMVIGGVGALTWALTINSVPEQLTIAFLSVTSNKYLILFLINILLLIFGCVMGMGAAVMLATPLLFPIATQLGLHPVHFGLIVVANLAIGAFTPPVGGTLYLSSQLAEVSVWDTVKGLLPFYIANFIVLMLITYIPEITLILPRLVGVIK